MFNGERELILYQGKDPVSHQVRHLDWVGSILIRISVFLAGLIHGAERGVQADKESTRRVCCDDWSI